MFSYLLSRRPHMTIPGQYTVLIVLHCIVDGDRYHRSVNEIVTGNCTISMYLARNDNLE